MMRRLFLCTAIACLLLATACCPTIWLQVSKDRPAPWPPVQVHKAVQEPPSAAMSMPNRFDVLEGGVPTVHAQGFRDVFDAEDNPDAFGRAVAALSWIERTYPKPSAVRSHTAVDKAAIRVVRATLDCADANLFGFAANCRGLQLSEPTKLTRMIWVEGLRYAVNNDECWNSACTNVDLGERIPGKQGQVVEVYLTPTSSKMAESTAGNLSQTLLSFVHLSDIHVRDPSVTLTNRQLSHKLDRFDALASFEYDEDLVSYNPYLLQALFGTIAKMKTTSGSDDSPKFVIHTGDSTDTGSASELNRLDELIDRLNIPFYEVFGNHDVLYFGNLTPTPTHDSEATCTPVLGLLSNPGWFVRLLAPSKLCVDQRVVCPDCIGDEGEFIPTSTQAETRRRFMARLHHAPSDSLPQWVTPDVAGDYCPDTHPRVWSNPFTRDHGFDLGTKEDRYDGENKLGYYAFAAPLGSGSKRNLVTIVLNTEDLKDGYGGTRGRVGRDQFAWLDRVLACVKDKKPREDLVMVFAHHPLSRIEVEPPADHNDALTGKSVAQLLNEASPNVVGYFYGHGHDHSICGDNRDDKCKHYWEVETASLIEFPQEGRLVRIKQINDDLGFFELTALRERLTDENSELARHVQLARRGAERDFCYTRRGSVRCSVDQRPYRTDGRDTNARLFFALPK